MNTQNDFALRTTSGEQWRPGPYGGSSNPLVFPSQLDFSLLPPNTEAVAAVAAVLCLVERMCNTVQRSGQCWESRREAKETVKFPLSARQGALGVYLI